MQLMTHEVRFLINCLTDLTYIIQDQTVRYNALIAVQKMMVNNWEILGRQITVG